MGVSLGELVLINRTTNLDTERTMQYAYSLTRIEVRGSSMGSPVRT